ncbi:MAG TPA: hypothetical protein VF703_18545 [Pyrinomonadaceae bacterium]
MKIILLLIAIIHLPIAVCFGQDDFVTVLADANACELNSVHFDILRNELGNDPTARITAKFYRGRSENNIVSEKRAAYVRKFLEQDKGFAPSRLEFVNSGKLDTTENPKIKFYLVRPGEIEGKLYLVSYAQLNQTPCLDCCEDERVFPQYIGAKPKKKITKQRIKRRVIKTRRTTH